MESQQIKDLYLIGLSGCQCVSATAQGAIKHSFKTHLLPSAISSFRPKHAEKLFKKLESLGAEIVERLP